MSKDVLGETEAAIWSEMCDNCTNYVFPTNQRHPLSGPRLDADAKYGPAIPNVLSGGKGLTLCGAHSPMLPHEHTLVMRHQTLEMLQDVYLSRKMLLTDSEQEELLQCRSVMFDLALRVTAHELQTIFETVRRTTASVPAARATDAKAIRSKVFTAISTAIQTFRSEKVRAERIAGGGGRHQGHVHHQTPHDTFDVIVTFGAGYDALPVPVERRIARYLRHGRLFVVGGPTDDDLITSFNSLDVVAGVRVTEGSTTVRYQLHRRICVNHDDLWP